mmetsp:Transcript_7180/g.22014  ORF Transcript_7180/g.22014 Transcript_7180/m.22014 type:complete len:242 (-) Transcript_7180:423-1148(-)
MTLFTRRPLLLPPPPPLLLLLQLFLLLLLLLRLRLPLLLLLLLCRFLCCLYLPRCVVRSRPPRRLSFWDTSPEAETTVRTRGERQSGPTMHGTLVLSCCGHRIQRAHINATAPRLAVLKTPQNERELLRMKNAVRLSEITSRSRDWTQRQRKRDGSPQSSVLQRGGRNAPVRCAEAFDSSYAACILTSFLPRQSPKMACLLLPPPPRPPPPRHRGLPLRLLLPPPSRAQELMAQQSMRHSS